MTQCITWAQVEICKPDGLHIMDGSVEEDAQIKQQLVKSGVLIPLPKYDNCFLANTDPRVREPFLCKLEVALSVFEIFFALGCC